MIYVDDSKPIKKDGFEDLGSGFSVSTEDLKAKKEAIEKKENGDKDEK